MTSAVALSTAPLVNDAIGLSSRPYQTEGIDFLRSHGRGMITDAPGLGKTPQAFLASELPVIVASPTYLTGQWLAWVNEHFPHLKAGVASGNKLAKGLVVADNTLDVLIINKEMCRTHRKLLQTVAWRFKTFIVDESHHFRNHTASHAQGAVELAKLIPRCYLLTATPIWKEVDDLYMQLRILFPDVFTSYWDFVDKWCISDTDRFSTKIYGVKKEMIGELEELLDVVRIGRTYKEAGRALPPIIENVIKLDFGLATRRMYENAKEGYRIKLQGAPDLLMSSAMEVLHTLRQITGIEKVDAIRETVDDTFQYHDDRFVVFTWYKDEAYRLAQELPECVVVTGDQKPEERQALAKSGKPVIATISSLSEGIDLSHMRMVIFAEEHWPPGSAVQALARVRRERQVDDPEDSERENAEPILVYYITVNKTIDENIHEISKRRSASIKELLSEALDLY